MTLREPPTAETTLPNGLTVIAVRRPTVPLVEVRLRIPIDGADQAAAAVLSQALTVRTTALADTVPGIGGQLYAATDVDRLLIAGSCLADGLPALLDVIGGCLADDAYDPAVVRAERDRLAGFAHLAGRQPALAADEALNRLLYGDHPYGRGMDADGIAAVTPESVAGVHRARVLPAGAALIVVGDVDPVTVLRLADRALSTWDGRSDAASPVPPVPHPDDAGSIAVVHTPMNGRAVLRVAVDGVGPDHPDHAALELANLVLGGYCSSRLFRGLRDRAGLAYSVRTAVLAARTSCRVVASLDVAGVSAAGALVEVSHELGRLSTTLIEPAELASARRYADGWPRVAMASQAGLADLLLGLVGHGLRFDSLLSRSSRLSAVTPGDVLDVARRHLAPRRAVRLVLGDRAVLTEPLRRLAPVLEIQ